MSYRVGQMVIIDVVVYRTALLSRQGGLVWHRVKAEVMELPSLPEHDFAWRINREDGLCYIYECSTGLMVSCGESLGAAKEEINLLILEHGIDYVRAVSEASIKRVGVRNMGFKPGDSCEE